MTHEYSILYGPVNALWHSLQHRYAWNIPDHVIMALLVLVISAIIFPLASRRISKDNPSHFQHTLELLVEGLRGLLHEIIGPHSERYLYIIGAFAVFIFISNIFGLFYFLQPPTSNVASRMRTSRGTASKVPRLTYCRNNRAAKRSEDLPTTVGSRRSYFSRSRCFV
jgi:F0F1-type ATP synthase membrane subunit a